MDQLPGTLKTLYKSAKNTVLQVPEIERKVKEATSNEKWGPTGTQMREISRATHSYHDLPLIMGTIWRRLNDHGKYWRHVYKSLLLVDYLLKNGAEQVIRECRDNVIQIQTLTEFQYVEEDKDVGLSVRERAKAIVELLHDEKRLKSEREKAKQTSKKFSVTMDSDRARYGGTGGGGYDYEERDSDRDRDREREREKDSDRERDRDRERERERENQREREDSDDEREREREKEREQRKREKEREEERPRSNSTRSGTSRPRAPSASNVLPPVSSQPQPNLFDLDTPAPQSTSQPGFDFFNQQSSYFPSSSSQPGFQSSSQQGFQSSSQPGFQSSSQPGFQSGSQPGFQQSRSQDFFDPRGNSGTPQTQPVQQSSSASDWAEFSGADDSKKESAPSDPNDPWSHAHLFDLNKSKQIQGSSSTSSTSQSAPMGAMGGKPMGPGKNATPVIPTMQPVMGNPAMGNPAMGRGTPVYQQPGMYVTPQVAINPMTGQPMMGQPMMGQPMMGQPMMGQPMMGQPMMGYGQPTTYGQPNVYGQPQRPQQPSNTTNSLLF